MNIQTFRRSFAILIAAGLIVLSACHSDSRESDIKPVRAQVSFETPTEPPGPVVFLRVASTDTPDDDAVPLDVVLRTGGADVPFEAFSLEIRPTSATQPGTVLSNIVRLAYDSAAGTTPWGTCGTCVRTEGCGTTVCGACSPCPDPLNDPLLASVVNPICASATSGNGTFLVSVDFAPASLCTSASAPAGSDVVIARITAFAQTVGTVRLQFIDVGTGDSDLLTFPPTGPPVPVPITFDDRGAVFAASR